MSNPGGMKGLLEGMQEAKKLGSQEPKNTPSQEPAATADEKPVVVKELPKKEPENIPSQEPKSKRSYSLRLDTIRKLEELKLYEYPEGTFREDIVDEAINTLYALKFKGKK